MVKYVIKELTDEGRLVPPLVNGGYGPDYDPFQWEYFNTPEEASSAIDEKLTNEGKTQFGSIGGLTHRNLVIVAKYINQIED